MMYRPFASVIATRAGFSIDTRAPAIGWCVSLEVTVPRMEEACAWAANGVAAISARVTAERINEILVMEFRESDDEPECRGN